MDTPDRRSDPRIPTDQPVTVTVLGPSDPSFSATLANFSGRGACLVANRDLPPSSLLKIEMENTLLLGEVIHSRPVDGAFEVGVLLDHALHHTGELSRLAKRLLGEKISPVRVE